MSQYHAKVKHRLSSEVRKLGFVDSSDSTTHDKPDEEESKMSSSKAWAVVAGVGPGTGASVARQFAKTYSIALLARKPANYEPLVKEINESGGHAIGISTDTSDDEAVVRAFDQIKKEMQQQQQGGQTARLAAAIYNVGGSFVRKPFLELSRDEVEAGWSTNGRGAANFSRQVIPLLLEDAGSKQSAEHPPTLIFTSATAAMKGSAKCASFAMGKFAMRALAQSLAREFGPQGVHVVHAIIDGVIDIERTKGYVFDHPEAKIKPEAIADSYWYLHTQPRTCFTNEIDIRPAVEKW